LNKKPLYTLQKGERIKSRKAIEQLFAEGKHFSVYPFRVTWRGIGNRQSGIVNRESGIGNGESEELHRSPSPTTSLQAAFSVGRRQFKRAVDRNRIKRLMREAWRLQKIPLQDELVKGAVQLQVFLVYSGRELPDFQLVKEKMKEVLLRLQKSVHGKTTPYF
jgi:ribonuclease P protein component